MNKIIILILVFTGLLGIDNVNAQGFTPPSVILGLSLDGNFATNDAHGTNFYSDQLVYGMIWGRGISVYSKFGLGIRKNHRITISGTYNKMINDIKNQIPFFTTVPTDGSIYTNYTIWSGAVGYEYGFNPRCKSKQYIGVAITANSISTVEGAFYQYDPAFRVGVQVSTGYEFVLDKNFNTGLTLGLKYNLYNVFGTSNAGVGSKNINDAAGIYPLNFWRRIGTLCINLGFNLYSGVTPYKGVR